MSMRDFIVIVGGLAVSEEDFLGNETLMETTSEKPYSTWISTEGTRVLMENESHLQILTENDEFFAEWEGELSPQAAEKLVEMISEAADCESYSLNSMTFLMKRQAIAAAKSLARHP